MDPKVSFVVPCYKLAHFLGACVNSILAQTYGDFEALIMDDCSPDNTPEVAAEFKDPRVIYIRNEINLGNIRNYNKGIELARGRYVWLISADDYLRSREVLRKYVDFLDKNPHVGYVFCPAMSVREGKEYGLEPWSAWPGKGDQTLSGLEVVRHSAVACPVCQPTSLVRKECYTRIGGFPVSLPRAGDWYFWVASATAYDVGYFAEPMVCYRRHATNMEKTMERDQASLFFDQELMVRWMIIREVQKAGMQNLYLDYCHALASMYVSRLVDKAVNNFQYGRTWDVATQEIRDNASSEKEAEEILRLIRLDLPTALAVGYTYSGASHYKIGQLDHAITSFRFALTAKPWSIKPIVYLVASKLEQVFGIRLVPWLKALKGFLPL